MRQSDRGAMGPDVLSNSYVTLIYTVSISRRDLFQTVSLIVNLSSNTVVPIVSVSLDKYNRCSAALATTLLVSL